MKHLTDDQLQDRLDQGKTFGSGLQDAHLRSCRTCRERLITYERLYAGLRQDQGYELIAGFSDSVMTRLAAAAPAPASRRSWESVWIGVGLAAIIYLVAYFVDLNSLAAILVRPFAPLVQTSHTWLTTARDSLSSVSGYTGPLLVSSLILLTVMIADNLLLYLKDKRFCL
ncbi:MAG: hypothetical protein KOO62_13555 [candidate division Zixibacteria bacterium]|nr:hypothetical protein [candidate division Zixibacteria bacterium]